MSYELVRLRREDIFLIMQWRNEQMKVLRQNIPITPLEQQQYYETVIEPAFSEDSPDLILFSFLESGECIGYGGLTHIDWNKKRGEVSFLLATDRASFYEKEFRIFLKLLKDYVFDELVFDEMFTETYDIRPQHIEILEDEGFHFQKRTQIVKNGVPIDSLFHICRRSV